MMYNNRQYSFLISSLILLQGLAFSQDIVFTTDDDDPLRPNDSDNQLLVTNKNECEKLCVTLDLCPQLFSLLLHPTRVHVGILQRAACGFTASGDPLVWCEVCGSSNNNDTIEIDNDTGQSQLSLAPRRDEHINAQRSERIQHILNQEDCGTAFPGRISGGDTAARGEFPWVVAIGVHTSSGPQTICGGALIAEDWVLTAAHCVSDSTRHARNVSHVRVGAHNITKYNENGAENIPVSQIFFHEQFRERPVVKNDIALLKLRRKVVFGTTVGPICVPMKISNETTQELYAPNSKTVIAGWGSDGQKPGSNLLQKVEIPLVSGESCKKLFQRVRVRVLPDLQVCAGTRGRDSCKGDSGGPLMKIENQKAVLIGIISFGTVQCDGRLPGVYTKLSSYMDWVVDVLLKHNSPAI